MEKQKFDFESFQAEAIERLRSGDAVLGKDGILTPLLKQFLEKALEGEMESYLTEEKAVGKTNRRNGKSRKVVKTTSGEFELETPRDREGNFEPEIVKKREVFLGEDLEDKIIKLYARGMSYQDIREHLAEAYGLDVSSGKISTITDKILPDLEAWRTRRLEPVYTIMYLDAVHFKVREGGLVKNKALYNAIGIRKDGHKELIGIYISDNESAKFWLSVLSDMQARGVEDILIACIDNLSGFSEAIETIFPKTLVQLCIVHQVRNTLRYVTHEDSKKVVADMQSVYQAPTLDSAQAALEEFGRKWAEKYPIVVKSWNNNWPRLSTYFDFSLVIRRAIYTNNPIEAYHRQLRKHTKNKGVFPSDTAVMKLIFLLSRNITVKWTMPMRGWPLVVQQLAIIFDDRLTRHLDL